MELSADNSRELDELLQRMGDSSLDDAGYARLAQILGASDAARQRYLEFIDLCVGLAYAMPGAVRRDQVPPAETGTATPLEGFISPPWPAGDSSSMPLWYAQASETDEPPPAHATSGRWIVALRDSLRALALRPLAGPAAAMLLVACFGILWAGRPLLAPRQNHELRAPRVVAVEDLAADFAARIVSMTNDTTWDNPNAKVDPLFRIGADETLRVISGLVKLEFHSGAVVILHAPVDFTPTGPGAGRLDRGRLTVKVGSGTFRLTTKVADVIDHGAEFGVAVDDALGTDVLVFDGEVEVLTRAAWPAKGEALRMTHGMATRITAEGTAEHDFPAQPEGFARSRTPPRNFDNDRELSLVDVICGGNGLDNYLAGAIDPRTGKSDSGVWLKSYGAGRRSGDGLFHATGHRPPLDGVFVPNIDGKPFQVDSLGHTVDSLVSGGQTFGPIWARRRARILDTADDDLDFWGTGTLKSVTQRLQSARHGVVGVHPNVGFTIDLQAARMQQHCGINAFEAVLVNLDSSDQWNPKSVDTSHNSADFRVYVDGILRYSRLSFKSVDGDIHVAVPLNPSDQRLALITTEGEGLISYDDVILIDPVLTLDKAAQGRASE